MHHSNDWLEKALKYRPILQEYCQLAMRFRLNDRAADRMAAILQQAEADPMLNWLMDEADHLIAHLQNLIHDAKIQEQHQQLQAIIETLWMGELIKGLRSQDRPQFTLVAYRHP